jgi:hypothetical protein
MLCFLLATCQRGFDERRVQNADTQKERKKKKKEGDQDGEEERQKELKK